MIREHPALYGSAKDLNSPPFKWQVPENPFLHR